LCHYVGIDKVARGSLFPLKICKFKAEMGYMFLEIERDWKSDVKGELLKVAWK
jgi:hypothetical protein